MRSIFIRRASLHTIFRLAVLLWVLFFVLNATSVTHGQTTLTATVTSTQLKMRATPSLRGTVIFILARNLTLTVDGRNRAGSWVHAYSSPGVAGWVYRYYLKFPRGTNIFKLPIQDGNSNTNPQAPSPVYESFTSQSPFIEQSGKVTLQWTLQGNVLPDVQYRINGVSEWHGYSDLPTNSTLTVDLKPFVTSQSGPLYFVDFWLRYGQDHWQYLRLDCPPSLFYRNTSDPMICPLTPPQSVQAAYQPFEKGFMIWRGDIKEFYAMSYDGNMQYWGGSFDMPNKPLTPSQIPPGLYQPVSGFGRLWDNLGWIRPALGWATAPESSYVTTIRESMSSGNIPYNWLGRVILTLPNGRVINISRYGLNTWLYVD